MPEGINAFIKAHAPGTGIISILFFIASFTISSPGSDIAGVPASDTKAILFPFNIFSMRILLLDFSICL
jgi:hypothetical protein